MSYWILDEITIARKKTNAQIGIFQLLSFTLDYIKVCPGRFVTNIDELIVTLSLTR